MNDKLQELLALAAENNQQAFKQLYDLTAPRLYSLARFIVKRDALAEEILQEAYIKIWKNAARYNPQKSSVLSWMMVITRNQVFDTLRYLKSRPQEAELPPEDFEHPVPDLLPDTQAALDQYLEHLAVDVNDLKKEQKECIVLSHIFGYTHTELANRLNKPLGTVKSWLRRGNENLHCLSLEI